MPIQILNQHLPRPPRLVNRLLIYDCPRCRVLLMQLVNIADVVVNPHRPGTLRILSEKDVHLAIGYGGKGLVLLLGGPIPILVETEHRGVVLKARLDAGDVQDRRHCGERRGFGSLIVVLVSTNTDGDSCYYYCCGHAATSHGFPPVGGFNAVKFDCSERVEPGQWRQPPPARRCWKRSISRLRTSRPRFMLARRQRSPSCAHPC